MAIRPGETRKRLNDGDGLYLPLFLNGGAHAWRFDYAFHGKRKTLSFGVYPDTSLALARRKADEARQLVAEGLDPSQKRKAERAGHAQARSAEEREVQGLPPLNSFEDVAREWYAVRRDGWARSYGDKIIARFENDVFPLIGRVPVADVTPPMLLEVMRREAGVSWRPLTGPCRVAARPCATPWRRARRPAIILLATSKGAQARDPQELPGDRRSEATWRAAPRLRPLCSDACRACCT